eukprot:CAMPEP_0196718792 /NCGR_PEP_ID=MMETSP1091-20130531/1902_1 /TAXON_ID=302021 /ORGANISM="Rhodomonas sp., Strain CCMP768" /LENGTH=161 /DNA_ID=CAMNT_0042059537 /DNA_START=116 /DNA_END=602 /DNA_ORIENTATION=+
MDAFSSSDIQKIGIGLTAMGVLFTMLGVLLFFDGGLLAVGNLLFLSGVGLILGLARMQSLFFQSNKLRGTVLFFSGLLLVIFRWPKVGFFVEAFGFVNLFGNFLPHVIIVAKHTPVVSKIFDLPGVKQAADYLQGANQNKANQAVDPASSERGGKGGGGAV